VSRLPITTRLTIVFAVVMAAVLLATGLFLYRQLGSRLDRTVEEGLRQRADDVAAFVRRSHPGGPDSGVGRLTDSDESFTQVTDARGRVLSATPPRLSRPVLTPQELSEARRTPTFRERRSLPGFGGDPLRLLAAPVATPGGPLVVVVGTSVDDRDEALHGLLTLLLIGGPAALLLATLTAVGVAHAALRPVEAMRRQAAAISGSEPDRRLPVPSTHDELSRLGETLNAMLGRLQAALAHERAFVADASHELRTPLTILKTELDLAMLNGRSVEELREAVRSAAEETDRLVRIAEDLLVIAQSEQGRLPTRFDRIEVGAVLENVAGRFRRRLQELGRTIDVRGARGMTVVADRLRVEQALGNMVDNALRHGGGRVTLVARERDGYVELHVLDEGPGFPGAFRGRAFERFSRADESRAGVATGLGLAVVESIAVAHGGRAHAVNRTPSGADVWLSLPAGGPRPPDRTREAGGGAVRRVARRLTRWRAAALVGVLALAAVVAAALQLTGRGPGGSWSAAPAARTLDVRTLLPVAETEPVPHRGDAADDPAIWRNPHDPARSTIIGTDKDGGLAVYDLSGRKLQYLPDGRLNNVDLRSAFPLGRRRVALVAASNGSDNTVMLYRIDERTRRLAMVGSFPVGIAIYGLCMYRSSRTGDFHVFVNSRDKGYVDQWRLEPRGNHVGARSLRRFEVGTQAEGCVADDALGHLYVGEEDRGVWKYGAEPDAGVGRVLVDSTEAGGHLTPDVEGLAIAEGPGRTGLLIASSQGDDTFAVYRREGDNDYVGSFRIRSAASIGAVEQTDGIAVTTAALGDRFPNGVFVAHDGRNGERNQNFKLVRWRNRW
jgi:two-component system, OmpR family, sensor kinase